MPSQLDWRKGKDAWEEIEVVRAQPPAAPPRRPWSLIFTVVLIIGLIGASVIVFVNHRTSENLDAIESSILGTNALVFQAIMAGDVELLRSNMSGRDPDWVASQENALAAELMYDRPLWGLDSKLNMVDESEIEIGLNPEWNTAELVIPLDYSYEPFDGLTKTVQLEQTLVYRRNSERWLLAPADINFWGERFIFEGQYLTLNYPERDQEIVVRLAAELDDLIRDLCTEIEGMACAADFQLTIRLDDRSSQIGSITSPLKQLPCVDGGFNMPTPTLVGLPVDEAGYEILLQGYRTTVAASALTRMIYSDFCPNSPLTIAMLDYRLTQLGFQSWPLKPVDYLDLVEDQVHLRQANFYINNRLINTSIEAFIKDNSSVYAIVEFLIEGHETTLEEIEKNIVENPREIYFFQPPLSNWTNSNYASNRELEFAWEQFLRAKAGNEGEFPQHIEPPFPGQDLLLVCLTGLSDTTSALPDRMLYALDLQEEEWITVDDLRLSTGFLLSSPGDEGVIIVEQRFGFLGVRTLDENEPIIIVENSKNWLPVTFVEKPSGDLDLMVYNVRSHLYELVQFTKCLSRLFCLSSAVLGYPIWSPSGERILLTSPGNFGYERQYARPFILGRFKFSGIEIGEGSSQFWLSDEQFGYVATDGRTVMVSRIGEDELLEEAEVLFTLEEVDPILAIDPATTIESVLSNPEEPEDLIVTVRHRDGGASVYQVNLLRRWIQKLVNKEFELNEETVYSFDFSPETRWLVISGHDSTTSTTYLHFYDLDENEVRSYQYKMVFERPIHWAMDWSAGDEWLAVPDNGYVRLINPAADYQTVIVPDGVTCSDVVWVNDNEL